MDALREHAHPGRAGRPLLRRRRERATSWWSDEYYRLVKGTAGPAGSDGFEDGPLRRVCERPPWWRCSPASSRAPLAERPARCSTSTGGAWRWPSSPASRPSAGCRPGVVRLAFARRVVPRGRARRGRAPGGRLPRRLRRRRLVLAGGLVRAAAGRVGARLRSGSPRRRRGSGSSRTPYLGLAAWRRTPASTSEQPRDKAGASVVVWLLLGLVVLFGGAYVGAHYAAADKVTRGTTVSGVSIGGHPQAEAAQRLPGRPGRAGLRPRSRPRIDGPARQPSTRRSQGIAVDYEASVAEAGGERQLGPGAPVELLHRRPGPSRPR